MTTDRSGAVIWRCDPSGSRVELHLGAPGPFSPCAGGFHGRLP